VIAVNFSLPTQVRKRCPANIDILDTQPGLARALKVVLVMVVGLTGTKCGGHEPLILVACHLGPASVHEGTTERDR
jgi:hypothetical protein